MNHFEKKLSSRPIFDGRVVHLREDEVELENGRQAVREVIDHTGGVCVAPLEADGTVLFVRQFRYPFGKELIELPAGKLERGEDPAMCGRRELSEEVGREAGVYRSLGCLYPTPAYDTEITYLYYAAELTPVAQHLDEDEFLDILRIPFDEAVAMVLDGRICDAKTQLALLKIDALRRRGELPVLGA